MKAFQQGAGATVDGIVGPQTWAKLMGPAVKFIPSMAPGQPAVEVAVVGSDAGRTQFNATGVGPAVTGPLFNPMPAKVPGGAIPLVTGTPNVLTGDMKAKIMQFLTQYKWYIAGGLGLVVVATLIYSMGGEKPEVPAPRVATPKPVAPVAPVAPAAAVAGFGRLGRRVRRPVRRYR